MLLTSLVFAPEKPSIRTFDLLSNTFLIQPRLVLKQLQQLWHWQHKVRGGQKNISLRPHEGNIRPNQILYAAAQQTLCGWVKIPAFIFDGSGHASHKERTAV
ncbi:MAG: hypothetical protein GX591_08895 [Planctomycetes bacterium]|nr:hypothetical protein [Planctomycetota bacterium]